MQYSGEPYDKERKITSMSSSYYITAYQQQMENIDYSKFNTTSLAIQ